MRATHLSAFFVLSSLVGLAGCSDGTIGAGTEEPKTAAPGAPAAMAKPAPVESAAKGTSAAPIAECTSASDCPGVDSACAQRECIAGKCILSYAATTTMLTDVPGDCRRAHCDGSGAAAFVFDATDVPTAIDECTVGVCTATGGQIVPREAGAACATGVCDGSGKCVECVTASACGGTATDCSKPACVANACAISHLPSDTVAATQTTGDCKTIVCDGAGGTRTVPADTDVESDGNPCTLDSCEAGVPKHTKVAVGTSCGAAKVCDEGGRCVPAPPTSCADALARGATTSGSYVIDPNGGSPSDAFTVKCDMTTAGGGWTIVFVPESNNFTSHEIEYTVGDAKLWAGAREALVAYRNGADAAQGDWAKLELPARWRTKTPFQYAAEREDITVSVSGAEPVKTALFYGYSSFNARCEDDWDTSASWGRICFANTKAPFYGAWATDETQWAWLTPSDDDCPTSLEDWNATECSNERRFTIAIR